MGKNSPYEISEPPWPEGIANFETGNRVSRDVLRRENIDEGIDRVEPRKRPLYKPVRCWQNKFFTAFKSRSGNRRAAFFALKFSVKSQPMIRLFATRPNDVFIFPTHSAIDHRDRPGDVRALIVSPRKILRLAALLILIGGAMSTLQAHETWLVPAEFAAAQDAEIRFDLTSGMNFPVLDFAIRPERIGAARFRQRSEIAELETPASAEKSLQFRQKFPASGLVTAWVVLEPKTLELSEAKVAEYFEEISAPRELRELWAKLKSSHKWTETYTKCAKTFLVVGEDAPPDASWQEPVGLPLEIVPLKDPAAMRKGDSFAIELKKNGKPFANTMVGLMPTADGKRIFRKTDGDGRAEFTLDHDGPALFFAVDLQWQESKWISTFSTLTAKVGP